MDDFIKYLIVTCNDDTFSAASERVMHRKGLHATVAFLLGVGGVNNIMITLKSQSSVAANIVPLTMVPCTIIQAPVCLVQKNRRFSNVPWLLKVSRSFASFTIS